MAAVEMAAELTPEDSPKGVPPVGRAAKPAFTYFFPETWTEVFLWIGGYVLILMLITVPFGLAYDRFEIRGEQCYHPDTYYMKSVEEFNHSFCAPGTYPYRLLNPTFISRLTPSLLYFFHQLAQFYIIRQAQQAKERGEVGWPAAFDAPPAETESVDAKPAELTPEDFRPNVWGVRMFALNIGMVIVKFIQGHITYDGMANDVPEVTAQNSVIVWILMGLAIQMPKRGLFFGYWRTFENPCKIGEDFVPFVRKYHGYAVSWGVTYNFWYHAVEGSPGFILGYTYQFCMILQSAFLFHPFHRNKFWTLVLEMGLIPHAFLIAILKLESRSLMSMYMMGFGMLVLFISTHLHGFGLSKVQRAGVVVGVMAVIVYTYHITGRPFADMVEIFNVGSMWIFVPCMWVMWVAGSFLLLPFKGLSERHPWTTGALWFAIWAGVTAMWYADGPKGGVGADR